jgi:hypothetical protein
VNAALVKFVEDDRTELRQQRVALQPRGQHPFGDDQEARARGEAALEADLPADLTSDRPAALVGHPLRHRSSRDPSGLQQDDRPIVDQRRRNPGRLADARLRRDDDGTRSPDTIDDRLDVGIDRQRDDGLLRAAVVTRTAPAVRSVRLSHAVRPSRTLRRCAVRLMPDTTCVD